jgi:hypothetical protein
MRSMIVAVTLLALASSATAETRDELQARGEALGREGKWSEAIRSFKAAEKLEHRTIHACLIMLAYTRREAWAQAEVFLSRCLEPTPGETLPDWVAQAEVLIRDRLGSEQLAPVTIEVVPAGTHATLTASSFEPDEVFTPRTIHLTTGHHLIVAHVPGYPDQQRALEIDSVVPRHVVIEFLTKPGMSTRKKLLIAGAAVAGLGAVSYAIMGVTYLQLPDSTAFNDSRRSAAETTYKVTRVTTIGCWALGAGLLIAGALVHPRDPEATVVSAVPIQGGAIVTIGWTR